MSPHHKIALPLTKDNLYQLIVMNPATIGRSSLVAAFAFEDGFDAKVDQCLQELIDANLIFSDHGKGFKAVKPWADLSYAVVGPVTHDRRLQIHLRLPQLTQDIPVILSRNEVIRQSLKAGDEIIVGLTRDAYVHGALRAHFKDRAADNKPYYLVGTFNYGARKFTPMDSSIKTNFILPHPPVAEDVPRQFLVEVRPQSYDMRNPVIHVLDDQTRNVDTDVKISSIVAQNRKIDRAHPGHVLLDADRINRQRLKINGRADRRYLDFYTVDPKGATDLDDAVAVEKTDNGYALYTAIADVAAHVLYGSSVDRAAYERGMTYYLKDYTAHMLPPILSTKKCSLIAHQDRLAIVVRQNLDWNGQLKSFDVEPAVIRSHGQFSYGQFYDLTSSDDPRFSMITDIHDMRRRQGLHDEFDVFLKDGRQYHGKSIIETLMVQTNSLVAQFLKSSGTPFISRNFEAVTPNDRGVIARAYYSTHHAGHAALKCEFYAHFTSPIRRGPDLINGRAMHAALGNVRLGIHSEEVENLQRAAEHFNNRCRLEDDLTRDVEKYHALRDLHRLTSTPVRMNIFEIGPDYIDLTVMQSGLRQRIHARDLPVDQWKIDASARQLVLLHHGREVRRYGYPGTVLGRVYNVDTVKGHWDIELMPPTNIMRASREMMSVPA